VLIIDKDGLVFGARFNVIIEIIVIIWQWAIDEFHKRHWRRIACSETTLKDPGITARPFLIPRSDFRKQLAYGSFASHTRESQTPISN